MKTVSRATPAADSPRRLRCVVLRILPLLSIPMAPTVLAADIDLTSLHGKVQVVEHFADYTVKIVPHFPDLKVQWVEHLPDAPGKWQRVEHFADFTVQFVDHFPDFTIQLVEHFPGLP